MHFSTLRSFWMFTLLLVAPWAAKANQLTAVTITHSRPVGAECLAKLLGVEERSIASRVEQVKAGAVAGAMVGSTAQELASALMKMAALPSMDPGEKVVAAMDLTEESPTVNVAGAEISLFALPGAAVGAVAGAAFALLGNLDRYRVYQLQRPSGRTVHVLLRTVLNDEASEVCESLDPFVQAAAAQGAQVRRTVTDPRGAGARLRFAAGCVLRWTSPLVAAAMGVGGYFLETSFLFPNGIETSYALTALAAASGLGGSLLVGTHQAWLGWGWSDADLAKYLDDLTGTVSSASSGSHANVILIVPWFRAASVNSALLAMPGSQKISSEAYLAQVLAVESGARPEEAASFLASLKARAASETKATAAAVVDSVGRAGQALLDRLMPKGSGEQP